MGFFSFDRYKINNGVCLVRFERPGELTLLRVQEIMEKPKVKKCNRIVVIIGPKVTAIGDYAFQKSHFSSIIIPKSVKSIEPKSFSSSKCYMFFFEHTSKPREWRFQFDESPTKHNTLWGINGYGITDNIIWVQKNNSITICGYVGTQQNLTVPEQINGCPVETIGDYAFLGCSSLKSITLPDCVKTVGRWGFGKCVQLESVTLPNGITHIGDSAFAHCSSITSVTLPEGLTTIEPFTFQNCEGLESISIPESITNIGFYAFCCCSMLTEITIPYGVKQIEHGAFQECSSLATIRLPYSITSISENLFWSCTSLSKVTIPESVTSIGKYAFYGCKSLKKILIPKQITSMGEDVFSDCEELEIRCVAESKPEGWHGKWNYGFYYQDYEVKWGCPPPAKKTINE